MTKHNHERRCIETGETGDFPARKMLVFMEVPESLVDDKYSPIQAVCKPYITESSPPVLTAL